MKAFNSNTSKRSTHKVGEIRPSQVLFTYGVGAIIDLPRISTLIMGLDEWNTRNSEEIVEERLLEVVREILGPQVLQLLTPPSSNSDGLTQSQADKHIGVPVAIFPRWMRCPRCDMLASIDDSTFALKTYYNQPDRTCYIHTNCSKTKGQPPVVVPARFMVACDSGHLDDFPWHHFLHGDRSCKGTLRMKTRGVSGEPSDIYVTCDECHATRAMAEAVSSGEDQRYHPICRGHRPHLRDFDKKPCPHKDKARTILLSASNTWFPLVFTTLALPTADDPLDQLINEHWDTWQEATSIEEVAIYRKPAKLKHLYHAYSNEEIWQHIERKRVGASDADHAQVKDLKLPEWRMLIDPDNAPSDDDFKVSSADLPIEYEDVIQQVVLVERLREVRALTGFTRLESLSDYKEDEKLPREHIMPLARHRPTWVPATEVRGEGIFIQFREEAIQRWLEQSQVQAHAANFFNAHKRWRTSRHIPEPEANYPGLRYVLLHTFAHALMRQLTLESGYPTASIGERIYAQDPEKEGGAMAGILLYTSASDSEGTLGGLVSLGKNLEFHIEGALEEMKRCTSDPLCAEHAHLNDNTLHGAACHACMFAPETSCERGNRYLDRSVLVPTVENSDLAFFHTSNL